MNSGAFDNFILMCIIGVPSLGSIDILDLICGKNFELNNEKICGVSCIFGFWNLLGLKRGSGAIRN